MALKVGGKSHYEINVFLQNTLGTIICPLLLNTFCKLLLQREQLWVFSYNAWWVWRTPDKRSETSPPHRISPDSQIHVGASSLQFSPLIFNRVQLRDWDGHPSMQMLGFVLSGPFLSWCLFLDHCPVGRSKHGPF